MIQVLIFLICVYLLVGLIGRERTFHLLKAVACFGATAFIIAMVYVISQQIH